MLCSARAPVPESAHEPRAASSQPPRPAARRRRGRCGADAGRGARAGRDGVGCRVRGPRRLRPARAPPIPACRACSSPTAATSRSPTPRGATACRCPRRRSIFVDQAGGLHAAGRSGHRARRASTGSISPSGTPASLGLTFEGIAPTGPLPASLDFPLAPPGRAESVRGRAVHRSAAGNRRRGRLHPRGRDPGARRDEGARSASPRATSCSTISRSTTRYNAIIGTIGLPWWNIGGNHDLNFEAPDRTLQPRDLQARLRAELLRLLLCADAVPDARRRRLSRRRPDQAARRGKYEGRIDAAQLDFIRNVLAHTPDDTLIVVVMHIPLRTVSRSGRPDDELDQPQGAVRAARRAGPIRSASPATPTRPSITISTPPTAGAGRAHHHHVLTAVSGSWWSGPPDHRGVACADSRDGTPTASTSCRSTASPTRPASSRPRSRTAARCGSPSTAASTASSPRRFANSARAKSSVRRSRARGSHRRPSSPMSSTAGRARRWR